MSDVPFNAEQRRAFEQLRTACIEAAGVADLILRGNGLGRTDNHCPSNVATLSDYLRDAELAWAAYCKARVVTVMDARQRKLRKGKR